MADELTLLGVSWEDENDVRVQVAANVAVDASIETIGEQDLLQSAWRELHEAEAELQRLESLSPANRSDAYRLDVLAAERVVERRMKIVRQRQTQLEQKKQDLKASEMRQLQLIEAQKRREQLQAMRHCESAPEAVQPQALRSDGSRIALPYRPIDRRPAAITIQRRVASGGHSGRASVGTPLTDAVKEYRGGNSVVEPIHCVTLTRADRGSAAAGSYIDDGDEEMFNQRQKAVKRERSRQLNATRQKSVKSEEGHLPKMEDSSASISVKPNLLDLKRENMDEDDEQTEREDTFDFLEELMAAEGAEDHREDVEGSENGEELELPAEELVVPVPQLPAFTTPLWLFEALLDYQRVGLQWLIGIHYKRCGGILGDEMGLGKTVQVAALLNTLLTSKMLLGPILVVAPLTVVAQWIRELHRWCPALRACVLHSTGTSSSKTALIDSIRNKPAAVVTTYATMTMMHRELARANFQYVILDEGHKICNPETAVTMAAKTFFTPHRLILTGSPIQNTLKELWCLFDFAYPGLLGSLQAFVQEFESPISASRSPRASKLDVASAMECARVLKTHLQPFLLRRMKRDVNAMLPPKYERVIRCSLSDAQLEAYTRVLNSREVQSLLGVAVNHRFNTGGLDRHGRDSVGALWTGNRQFSGQKGLSGGARRQAFRILHSLRNLCNHVDIFYLKQDDVQDGGTGRDISFRSNNDVRYEGSGKLATLRRLLTHWKAHGHKVLIFSQFRMMLDIIENMCEQEKHSYMRMDGNTPSRDRAILIDRYNSDANVFAALLTTKVGGLGVNLTGADRVVIFDPDWNPVNDEQARERAWRIGQTREVCVYRMISSGTIEETILHRQLAKTYVTEKVLNDPTLQRCFSTHSFVDAFYLGTEYRQRLPPTLQHIISSIGDVASAESDLAMEGGDNELYGDGQPVDVKQESFEVTEGDDVERDHQKRIDILAGHIEPAKPLHHATTGHASRPVPLGNVVEGGASFRVTLQRTDDRPKTETEVSGEVSTSSARQNDAELSLLQRMVDGDAPSESPLGNDRVGRNLAIMTARDTLQRVLRTNSAPAISPSLASPQLPNIATRPRVKRERGGE